MSFWVSICIPTYNRADVLSQCLESIVNNVAFSDEFEIVISDNCSSDLTQSLVLDYISKYKNIKYFRNDSNVGGDRNILLALERGSGKFLKLTNDYSVFNEDSLDFLLKTVKKYYSIKPVLFFHQGQRTDLQSVFTSMDELLVSEKWGLSWIGNYGYWSDDFFGFKNRDFRIDTKFQQIDWLIRSFERNHKIICFNKVLTTRMPFKAKQGSYNFIDVHTRCFFIQFEELVEQKKLKKASLDVVKKNVFANMVEWLVRLKMAKGNRFGYKNDNGYKILKKQFSCYYWFYPLLIKKTLTSFYRLIVKEFIKSKLKH